jgi:hypothetical protein
MSTLNCACMHTFALRYYGKEFRLPPGGQKPLKRPEISDPAIKDIWPFPPLPPLPVARMISTHLRTGDYLVPVR